MKKKLFMTIVTLIGLGFIAKGLSTVVRIILLRVNDAETIGLFSMSSSVYILAISLVQLGVPTAITKLVSAKRDKTYSIISTSIFICLFSTLIVSILIGVGGHFFAYHVLKSPEITYTLYAIIPVLPLVCIGSILKAYYCATGKIEISAQGQIMEEIARLLFTLFVAATFSTLAPKYSSMAIMIGVGVGEIGSTAYMFLFIKKGFKAKMKKLTNTIFNPINYIFKDIVPVSISVTTSRLIGSLSFFVEPIIMSNILLNMGMSRSQINVEYALLASYAMPLILLPGFFTNAFSNILLPTMSKQIGQKNIAGARKSFLILGLSSFIVGLIFATICFFFPEFLLTLLYGTPQGADYVRFISFPFVLYYIQAPLSSALIALNQEKSALRDSIIGSTLRVATLVITIPFFKMYGVAIATIAGIFIVTFFHLCQVIYCLYIKSKPFGIDGDNI